MPRNTIVESLRKSRRAEYIPVSNQPRTLRTFPRRVTRVIYVHTMAWTTLNRSRHKSNMTGLPLSRIYVIRAVLFNGLDCGIDVIPLKGVHHENHSQNAVHITFVHFTPCACESLAVTPQPHERCTPSRSTRGFQLLSLTLRTVAFQWS
jgi:hypothetical protein